jgi:hypothetical protein
MKKKLPIGIQTFEKIRSDNYYYVDKTSLDLIDNGSYYFLSRPRRFGKSLFLDTLKELFEGNKTLFKGLAAEHAWDWTVQYPVLKFSFGGSVQTCLSDLQQTIDIQIYQYENKYHIDVNAEHKKNSGFRNLLIILEIVFPI